MMNLKLVQRNVPIKQENHLKIPYKHKKKIFVLRLLSKFIISIKIIELFSNIMQIAVYLPYDLIMHATNYALHFVNISSISSNFNHNCFYPGSHFSISNLKLCEVNQY